VSSNEKQTLFACNYISKTASPDPRINVQLSYPAFQRHEPAWLSLNAKIESLANAGHDEFLKKSLAELKRAQESFKGNPEGMGASFKWERRADYSVIFASDEYVSVLETVWFYTGGAHGNTSYKGILWHRDDEMFKPVPAEALFVENSGYLERISSMCIESLKKQGAQNVLNGSLLELIAIPPYVLSDTGLRFYFPPYTVGPYSQGSFIVDIPAEKVTDILQLPLPE